jgi:hypothetical protein
VVGFRLRKPNSRSRSSGRGSGVAMLSLRRGRGDIRCASLVSPSGLLPQEVYLRISRGHSVELQTEKTYHIQCQKRIELNESMEIPKQDGDRQIDYIAWISPKEAN